MATTSSPQRFNDYLNGLREEFDLQSNATSTTNSSPRRFYIYLGNLKGEFELMTLEIEFLRKERHKLEAKVREQERRLQDVRPTVICELCKRTAGAAPIASTPSQQIPSTRPTQHMVVTPRPQSSITPPQSIFLTTPQSPATTSAHSKTPSPSPHRPTSAVRRGLGHEKRDCSITFNDNIKKELDVEMVHVSLHRRRIRCVKFSQEGKYLAAACKDGNAYIYDVETGTLTSVLRNWLTEQDYVRVVCFSRDGKYLATSSTDGNIYIWEINTKYVRNAFKGDSRWIPSLDFSPNGRWIVSSHGNTVRLWNMRDGSTTFLTEYSPTFLDNPCYASTVFSPDGKYVAASHRDGVVRVWDARTATLLRRLKAHGDWVFDIALMPDGKGLLSGGTDTTLISWDIGSLYTCTSKNSHREDSRGVEEQTRPEREFSGHKGSVCSIAVSPDGKWVASGSRDHSIRIWDTRSAVIQCILNNVHKEVWAVDFSPAGSYLASGGYDGSVRIWRYSPTTS